MVDNVLFLIKEFVQFLRSLVSNKRLLIALTIDDFKQQYLGSYLGFCWALIKPTVFIAVIWFVFEVGFRAAAVTSDVPFVLWLMSGYSAWFYFSESLSSGVNAVISKQFLVKKVDFRVSILPLVVAFSALIIHFIFLLVVAILFLLNGFPPNKYWLQIPFYTINLVMFAIGLNWLVSSLRVFVKDIGPMIGIVLQVGFWGTPIFWSLVTVPERYQMILKLNPMYFLVSGYRESFIGTRYFWERGYEVIVFLGISLFFFVLGALVFKRLRPHFGDVL